MFQVKEPRVTEQKVAANRRKRKVAHGPSPYEGAAEIAPTDPNARLLRRMHLREVRRITNLLLMIKRHERQM